MHYVKEEIEIREKTEVEIDKNETEQPTQEKKHSFLSFDLRWAEA